MLEVSQLSRRYGDFVAVDNVSFAINKGEIVGLLGHNGAGKTTIMKMLSGYLEPNGGQIKINDVVFSDHMKTVQRQLGYLPENLPVYAEMTVADYLDYAAELKGLSGNDKERDIQRVVKATDIGVKLLAPIATLSRGYKQRVGVAQAILGQPKLLILDEPTNGLDPTQTEHMRALIRKLAKDATVILSTHIMQEVAALCTRVLIVRNGALVVDESLDNLHQQQPIVVSSSLDDVTTISTLNELKEIASTEVLSRLAEGGATLRLFLNADAKGPNVSAKVARKLLSAGADLYQLQLEQRDLEVLFREVNQNIKSRQVEVNHAV